MQNLNKTIATIIVVILVSSMAISIAAIQPAQGAEVINGVNYDDATAKLIHDGMHWAGMPYNISVYPERQLLWDRFQDNIPTWSMLVAAPNPVGVGQMFNLVLYNPQVPPNALLTNDIRYTFTLKVEKPNGDVENLPPSGVSKGSVAQGGIINGKYVSDSTGSTFASYTPDQTGNYTFTLYTEALYYKWNSTSGGGDNRYYGTTFLASNYTMKVAVQQDPVSLVGLPNIQPAPTEYWTRPIEGQNDQWFRVSSNWLSGPKDRDNGGGENRYQADGTAPNSPHILWTRPTEDNGIVGGANYSRDGSGNAFNAGSQYQPRFTNPIIMYGRLYYSPNALSGGSSSYYDCVDLKTGELIYEINTGADQSNVGGLGVSTTANTPTFGYYYSQDDPNEHGIQNPGWLFTNNFAIGYQPERGFPWLNITNVPAVNSNRTTNGVTTVTGTIGVVNTYDLTAQSGETLRYVIGNNSFNFYLAQWNSSKTIPMVASGQNPQNTPINGGTSARYDYNVSLPMFTSTPTIRAGIVGDFIWGSNGSWPTGTSGPSYYYPSEVTVWKISLKPETYGNITYMKNIDIDNEDLNTNNMFERASGSEHRFVTLEVPNCVFHIYDMDTGNEIAKTEAQSDWNAYGYFTWPSLISQTQTKMAYGVLYTAGYTGAVSAYSLSNGSLLWRDVYPSGGAKIQNYVQMISLIADGKIYVGTHEHSADTPLYKGERVHALNATTGEVIWDMSSWAYPMTFATADGVLIYWNNYDAQVYAVGKGPSQTTVSAPGAGVTMGNSVTITGTVTDISAGTNQQEQAARFPNGVPAVSDAAQAQWMEYVYMQKGKPTNTTGVDVDIYVIDSNMNYRKIGTTTTADGFFSFNWKPDIEGSYTVYAQFAGTESYYPSQALTAFTVDSAAPTQAPPQQITLPPTELYIAASTIAIIVAIAIIGLLMLRKRA